MNITFRPFNVDTDKEIISQFLVDTKKMTGTLHKDPQEDCDMYISAILNTQKKNYDSCAMMLNKDKIIGFVDIYPLKKNPDIGFLRFNYIIKIFRGKGFGKIIMEYVNKIMKKHNCKKIYLNVSENNQRAIAFYKKYGFKFTGRNKKHLLIMYKL